MKKTIGVILLAAAVFSCQPETKNDGKLNDEWTYKFTGYDESGAITNTQNINYTGTEKIVNGESYFYQRLTSAADNPALVFRLGPDGVYTYEVGSGNAPVLQYKYPGNPGDVTTCTLLGITLEARILSTSESVAVPAGTITDAYKYAISQNGEIKSYTWFTPSYWFLKTETIDSLSSGTGVYVSSVSELVSYSEH